MQDEIHVWYAHLSLSEQDADRLLPMLDPAEQARAARFALPHLRTRFIAAHAFVRQVIGQSLDLPSASVEYGYSSQGKPHLLNDRGIRFNLSHSADLAALAVARDRELGIDIEHIHELSDMLGLAQRYFAPAEISWLLGTAPEQQPAAFFSCWTAKEAYVKARGDGLSFPLDRFHVLPLDESKRLRLAVDGEPAESNRWHMTRLAVSETVLGALAVEGPECPIHFHTWASR